MSGIVTNRRGQDGVGNIHRRSSLAASLHSNLLGLGSTSETTFGSTRRRFSNVSDVVSRKLSHTMGWRSVSASVKITVSQGTSLCGQYIRNRLKRSGIFHRKLGLKRLRSEIMLPGGSVVGEVYPELISIGAELENMHPNLFTRIGRQVGCSTFSSEQTASDMLTDVSREMLRNGEMTWSKIIALYAVAGGIAVDCVRQGKPEYLTAIQRGMTEVLEDDLASWIQANGGWVNDNSMLCGMPVNQLFSGKDGFFGRVVGLPKAALTTRYRPVAKPTFWQVYRLPIAVLLTAMLIAVILLYR